MAEKHKTSYNPPVLSSYGQIVRFGDTGGSGTDESGSVLLRTLIVDRFGPVLEALRGLPPSTKAKLNIASATSSLHNAAPLCEEIMPDLVLLAHHPTDTQGAEVVEALRFHYPSVAIVVIQPGISSVSTSLPSETTFRVMDERDAASSLRRAIAEIYDAKPRAAKTP